MTRNRIGLMVFIVSFLLLGLNARAADIPMLMNYQGSVTDAVGVPVNGDGFFKFAIVNEAGDMAYWANDGTTMDGTEPTTVVTIPVSDGRFAVKLGDTDLTNMASLSPSVFDSTAIYLRVWFSIEGTVFEQFATDMQVVSTGFAFKAQIANEVVGDAVTSTTIVNNTITNADISESAAISASKIDSIGLDADTLDGNDSTAFQNRVTGTCAGQVMVGIGSDGTVTCETDDAGSLAETDPTVLASVKDGVSWDELSGRPAGLDDGDDVGITSESDPTVLASVKDGVSWDELSGRPAGLDDGDDVGITAIKQGITTGSSSIEITATSSGSAQNLTSLTVTPPADGYVFVVASGRFGINQAVVGNNYAYASISTISGQHNSSNGTFMALDSDAGTVALRNWVPLYINRVEPVTASTPVTFYAVAYRESSGNNSIFIGSIRLTAIFVPNLMP